MSSKASSQIDTGGRPVSAGPDGCPGPDLAGLLSDMLAAGRTLRFRVSGQSMHPTIQSGDYVVLHRPDMSNLRMGDLLLCRLPGDRMALHRLIAVYRASDGGIRRLITKGDGVDIPDPPLEPDAVLGRMIGIERHRRGSVARRRVDTKLSAGINLLMGVYHRIRSDVFCSRARFKSGGSRRRGNHHAA